MKVAIFSHEIPSTTFIENLILGLADKDVEIFLFGYKRKNITYKSPNIKTFFFKDSKVSQIGEAVSGSLKLLIRNPKKLINLYKVCFRDKDYSYGVIKLSTYIPILLNPVDIFHIQWGGDILYFKELYEILDCKIIVSFRGAHINYAPLFRPELRDAYLKNFPKTHAFHSVSNAIAKESLIYGASLDKIKTIYTSINPDMLLNPISESKIKSSSTINMISIGRFHWKKGYNYAIDALYKLKSQGIKVHYTIVAQGSDIEEYKFQIHQYNLLSDVTIINGLPHAEVIHKIKEADLFLLPSLEEGIANVAIEAMTLGTLVISTDCGGMTEAITDGASGYIVPVRDADAIVAKVKEYISTEQAIIDNMRKNARLTIEQKFTRNRMIDEFIELYQSVL
ncbi:MAG: glycosyltransferase family 4 protein [Bacteroidetes bacterium]|nr:glycosyltransferase family 4 protein [Bacteroidota bacterium]